VFSLERAPNSLSQVSKQRQLLQMRIKRGRQQGTGIFGKEFTSFKR
jgi:hypothetical protein